MLASSATLASSAFASCDVLWPVLLPLGSLIRLLEGEHVGAIGSLEDEGTSDWEVTQEPALFICLVSQGERRGSPWRKKARTFCDPFCPRPHQAVFGKPGVEGVQRGRTRF